MIDYDEVFGLEADVGEMGEASAAEATGYGKRQDTDGEIPPLPGEADADRIRTETERAINAAFKESGLINPYTGKPVASKAEYDEYRARYAEETQLFSVLLPHVSQEDWPPDIAPSLFKAIGFADDGVPIWTQPLGAHDAYMKGDTVSFNGTIWVSDADGNVWQPRVYGWTEAD